MTHPRRGITTIISLTMGTRVIVSSSSEGPYSGLFLVPSVLGIALVWTPALGRLNHPKVLGIALVRTPALGRLNHPRPHRSGYYL